MAPPTVQPRSGLRIALRVGSRVALTALVFVLLFSRIDAHAVGASLSRIPALALLAAVALLGVAVGTSVVRWRALMSAYGASSRPGFVEGSRLYLIGLFYNLLPGAVGGDVYRGYMTRGCFEEGAAVRSVGVVFVERVFGFSGLLVLTASATLISPLGDRQVLFYSGVGLCIALAAVVGVALGRRLAGVLPERLAKLASSLPVLEKPAPYATALVLSVLTHMAISIGGHLIVESLSPGVSLTDSLAIFPLGNLAAYFPLTVAGAGARDTALVVLFSKLGVARADALATSLALLAVNLLVSLIGGLLQLRAQLYLRAGDSEADTRST